MHIYASLLKGSGHRYTKIYTHDSMLKTETNSFNETVLQWALNAENFLLVAVGRINVQILTTFGVG